MKEISAPSIFNYWKKLPPFFHISFNLSWYEKIDKMTADLSNIVNEQTTENLMPELEMGEKSGEKGGYRMKEPSECIPGEKEKLK